MPEVGLLDDPIQAMQTRLQQLLADWPENPILTQLLVLCQRLTGKHRSPCEFPRGAWFGGLIQCSSCSGYDKSGIVDGIFHADWRYKVAAELPVKVLSGVSSRLHKEAAHL